MSSMIHSARPTAPTVVIIIFRRRLFCFEKWGRTDGNMCENNYHYRPGLWVGRVDQKKLATLENVDSCCCC